MKKVTFAHKDADIVIDVFDCYDDPNSTKAAEREQKEYTHDGKCVYQVMGSRVTQLRDKFLNIAANKMSFEK